MKTGEIRKNDSVHLQREGADIGDSRIKTLRKGKEEVEVAKSDAECGVTLKPDVDFKVGDVIISYSKISDA